MNTPESGFELIAERRSFSSFHSNEWDDFAAASGESFLGLWGVVEARCLFGRVKLFDFVLMDEARSRQKVGQCAIHVGNGNVTFLDRIQLLPAQRHLNRRCFDLIEGHFGDLAYKYGSRWNDEDEFDLKGLPRFDVDRTIFHLDLIDFRKWPDFAAYRGAVSENIRRDYKKAKEANAVARTSYGLKGLHDLFAFVAMRQHMARRNNLPLSRVRDYLTHAGRLLVLGKKAFVTAVRIEGKCYAAFSVRKSETGSITFPVAREIIISAPGRISFSLSSRAGFQSIPRENFSWAIALNPLMETSHDRGNLLYRRKLRVRSVNGVMFRLKPNQSSSVAASNTQVAQEDEPGAGKRARSAHA